MQTASLEADLGSGWRESSNSSRERKTQRAEFRNGIVAAGK